MVYNIVGTLTGLKTTPNRNNFNRTMTTRMVVTDADGTRYSGTRPVALNTAEVGVTVAFTADIARSSKIENWVWFKRPRCATVMS